MHESSMTIRLNSDTTMPRIGYGVFRIPNENTERAVHAAIECGYRSIDTAALYGNEAAVGRAIATCGLPREDLFITTKLWNDGHGYASAFREFDASLHRLGLEYVDLYLIHWPKPSQNLYVETWTALEKLFAAKRSRAIGVSNFQITHLERLLAETSVVPAVNQIELHPQLQQEPLRRFHAANGIVTEAWSPLGQGQVMNDPSIVELARRYDRSAAQIVLRWHLQLGNVVIPKSTNPSRILENISGLDFELTEADMAEMTRLDSSHRLGPDPDELDDREKPGFSNKDGRWVEPGT
jgi:2,5-diketo-D-gluconate reductase A